ncbi:MAG: SBBP repeat-containing protein, partial [Bryobacteraceae bacterium]
MTGITQSFTLLVSGTLLGLVFPALPAAIPTRSILEAQMAFEPNRGQAPQETAFVARGKGYAIHIGPKAMRLSLAGSARAVLEMEVVGSRASQPAADHPLPGRSNYFIGKDRSRHLTNVPHYAKVRTSIVYPGIDLVYYGNQGRLEYDFVVAPGADPSRIALRFRGQDSLTLSPEGDLVFRFGESELRQRRPVLYQLPGRKPVEGRFTLADDGAVTFACAKWDRSHTLVIDPVLSFASYLGGSANDYADAVAVDTSGNIYVAGTTLSSNYPAVSAYQGVMKTGGDAFITKLNPSGTTVLYSTFLGGTSGVGENAYGIAVDSTGNAYVTGESWSSDFPTAGPSPGTCNATAFLTKLAPSGNSLVYSRCFSYTRIGRAVGVDAAGNAYLAGDAGSSIPVVQAAQSSPGDSTDGFVGKLNAGGTAWTYLTYLGGGSIDSIKALAVDGAGNACVVGYTWSTNFPIVNALQPSNASAGPTDAFVVKYTPAGVRTYSTYLGGANADDARGVAIDSLGNCYVTGSTSSDNFPVHNAYRGARAGNSDSFVTAYNPTGSAFLYSTYLGGAAADTGEKIAVSASGTAHVTGNSSSEDFPSVSPIQAGIKDYGSVWTSTNAAGSFSRSALSGVSVNALAVDPVNSERIYAGTTDGVYRSINGGASWTRVDSGWTYTHVLSLAIDPNAPCTIYAGIDIRTNILNSTGILRASSNCGDSWGIPVFTQTARWATSLSLNSANPPVVYYVFVRNKTTTTFEYGVARSLPSGAEFSYPAAISAVAADPANACTAYAGDYVGHV